MPKAIVAEINRICPFLKLSQICFFVGCVRLAWYMLTYCRLGEAFSNKLYTLKADSFVRQKIIASAQRAEPRILSIP